jgi:hypothetical protein
MSIARIASWAHKWLALLVGLQILFWVASGLFFTLYPIEQVRSEHMVRKTTAQTIDTGAMGPLVSIRGPGGRAPTRITIERRAQGQQVVLAEFADSPPALFDAATLQRLSPIDAAAAARIAQAHVTSTSKPLATTRVTAESPEYRGALPAWRVQFRDHGLAVYVAENTGAVTARRSDLWRLYDALWALHIMDWRDHENFNHPLIVFTAALTLISTIAGIVLLPFRIRLRGATKSG